MDFFVPIVIFAVACILLSICGWCCKRKREGTVYGPGTNVSITTHTQPISASPVVVPPYPVEPRHPTPLQHPPMPGFAPQPPYPTYNPHPVAGAMYYPPPVGMQYQAPYPPAPYQAQPPSYSEAVGLPSVQPPPVREGYTKQAPYNPHY